MKMVMITACVVFAASALVWVLARDHGTADQRAASAGEKDPSGTSSQVEGGLESTTDPGVLVGEASSSGLTADEAGRHHEAPSLHHPTGEAPVEEILAGAAEALWQTRHPTVKGPFEGDEPFPFLNDLADVIREKGSLERLRKAAKENRDRLLEETRRAKDAHFLAIQPLLHPEGDDVEAIDAEEVRYIDRLRAAVDLYLGAGS